ncbi:MAG: choline-sulfatase [Planctomycetota bacterium]|jgi:choline-sulfatase
MSACGGESDELDSGAGANSPVGNGSSDRTQWSALLVTLDTTRADALSSFGGVEGLTPHLDQLAAGGIVFERAYTTAPLTLPAHASIMTGLTPPRHGLRVNGASKLPAAGQTLAELAREGGLATAAFVSAVVLDSAFGLDQGFQVYDLPAHSLVQSDSHFSDRSGVAVVQAANAWLREHDPKQRFFLWVHLWDPHGPWNPPAEMRALAPEDDTGYLGDVALADQAFGQLMEGLRATGHLENTVIAVVADHGEAFWEHGEYSHGALIHEPTMHVPMILRLPNGSGSGERRTDVVSVVDVLPTLSAALGLRTPQGIDGRDLFSAELIDGGAYLESYYGYLAYGWAPLVGYVDAKGKYIYGGRPLLFDPVADPEEKRELSPLRHADIAGYRNAIKRIAARPQLDLEQAQGNADRGASIAALGYAEVSGSLELPAPHSAVNRPDPRSAVAEHTVMLEALGEFNSGDYAAAERSYRKALMRNPANVDALERLGITLIRLKRFEEALVPLGKALESGHGSAAGAVNLGTCYRKLKLYAQALAAFEHALVVDASQVRAVRHLVDLYLMANQPGLAEKYSARFTELTGEALVLQERR